MDWDAAQKREAEFLSREGDAAAVYRFDEEVMTTPSMTEKPCGSWTADGWR